MSSAHKPFRQRGITMVESLVALVVLSVGMLGIASLYITSLKAGRSALVRTQAVNLVTDIADRIRANRAGKEDYGTAKYPSGPAKQNCETVSCTAAVLAQDDLFRWRANLGQFMPIGATGVVTFDDAADDTQPVRYTITVSWLESGDDQNSTSVLVVEL